MDVLNDLNPFFWVASNFLIIYTNVLLSLFVIGYYVLFDPRATTGGKLILRFGFALFLVMTLVTIGIYANPISETPWYNYPGESVIWWRPAVRAFVYAYIAFATTSLVVFLVIRKFWPNRLQTSADKDMAIPRHDHANTDGIPIYKGSANDQPK